MLQWTRFEEVTPLTGFDERGGSDGRRRIPFQMVPVGGERTVELKHAANVTVECTQPNALAVSGANFGHTRRITLRGRANVGCLVQAKRDGSVVASLEVSPKELRTLNVTFWFLTDGGGHKTTRKLSCVSQLVEGANRILTPQANIRVVARKAEEYSIPLDFGRKVNAATDRRGANEIAELAFYRDRLADATVFFVPKLVKSALILDEVEAVSYMGAVMIEDRLQGEVSHTLAHELVHHIVSWLAEQSIRPHTRLRLRKMDMLMHPSSPWGEKLSAAQINAINGLGTWLPPEDLRQ